VTNKHANLSYEVLQDRRGGVSRSYARIVCAQCGAHEEYTINGPHNPEAVIKGFRAKGWDADIQTARLCRCPACVGSKPKHDPDALIRHLSVVGSNTTSNEAPMAVPPNKTELTVDDKRRIRQLLDGVFDESKGAYLDGYTDDKAAAELTLPRKLLTDYRESAYGPLKVDPEVAAARTAFEAVEAKAAMLRKDFEAAMKSLQVDLDAARLRIGLLEKKRAA